MNRYDFYSNLQTYQKNSLEHHGIIGQKWGVRRYQNPDGSLTEEGRQRYLNPDGTLSDKAPNKLKKQYLNYQNQRIQKGSQTGEIYNDDFVYDQEQQRNKVEKAKENHIYDRDFVDTIQNAETIDDDNISEEYAKYVKNPFKYMKEFDAQAFDKQNGQNKVHKNDPYDDLTYDDLKKVKEKYTGQEESDEDIKNKQNELFKKKMNETLDKKGSVSGEDIERWNKEIEEETGHKIKTGKERAAEEKAQKKAEKAELNKAVKEAYKTASQSGQNKIKKILLPPLASGLLDWSVVNKAVKELGISSEEKKNMSASDWARVADKIKEMYPDGKYK